MRAAPQVKKKAVFDPALALAKAAAQQKSRAASDGVLRVWVTGRMLFMFSTPRSPLLTPIQLLALGP